MKYTEKDLYKGMKLRCVSTIEPYLWNIGKQYEVEKRTDGLFILKDETGYIWNRWLILDFLNGKAHCKMEIVEEEKEMKYTENDIKEGTKLRCVSTREPYWWNIGKVYIIEKSSHGLLIIKDETGYIYNKYIILDFLNNGGDCKLEIVEGEHAINLNAKARKLEEVLETIKEFE